LLNPRRNDDRTIKEPSNYSTEDERDAEHFSALQDDTIVNMRSHIDKVKREIPADQPDMANEMSDTPSRSEIAAELRAAEARTETRIEQLRSVIEARASASDHKIDLLIGQVRTLSEVVSETKASTATAVTEVKADSKETRKTVWIAGTGSILAILALVIAIWVAGINERNNMIAIFQAGLGVRQLSSEAEPLRPPAIERPPATQPK
jgi:hypothetical protein